VEGESWSAGRAGDAGLKPPLRRRSRLGGGEVGRRGAARGIEGGRGGRLGVCGRG
jgi:hypothetical protein